jgi:hypothetical protein
MNPNNESLIGRHQPRTGRSRAAFTLAELLIATGVTTGLVVMLGWMLGSLMRTSSHATARVDAFRDARAALQMIERDLRNLLRTQWQPDPFSNQTLAPCAASAVSTTGATLPAAYFALDSSRYQDPATVGNQNQQLYALVADRTSGSSGDVCAVGYYCRWDDQLHAYSLRRFFSDSATTFGVIKNVIQNGGTYAADSVLYSPNANDPVLAAFVWNFQVTIYDAAGRRYTTCPDPTRPGCDQSNNIYPCVCDGSAAVARMLPAAIEISFNAMSPQAARTVMSVSSTPNDWMDINAPNYQRLILPHVYQFRSRINLP